MTNLIVVQPFLHFARAPSSPPAPSPVSPPIPDGWAWAAVWAEEVPSVGLGKESMGQTLFFSVHFALFLALLVAATGLFMVAKSTSQDDRQEKREIVPKQDGTVEKELSRDETDTTTDTTDSSSTGSLSGSGSGTVEITQDSHQHSDKEDFTGTDNVCTEKPDLGHEIPESVRILLSPSSMSIGSCSRISQVEALCEWGGIELRRLRWEAEDAAELSRRGSTLSNGTADRLFADLEHDYSMFADSDSDDGQDGGCGDSGLADGQVGHLCHELEDEREVLLEENERLLVKCQQLQACQHMDGVVEKHDYSECELVPAQALLEVSAVQETATTIAHRRSFTGNVYNQLDEFELSLDMELEDFQKLGLFSSSDNENNTGGPNVDESEQTCTSSHESPAGGASCQVGTMTPVQDTSVQVDALETSKGSSVSSSRNPIHLLRRVFQAQDDDTMPAMATSDSLFSFSSDCSISQSSMSDFPDLTPIKRASKMSPQPNVEWGIIE